jgi:hypothetical protein
VGRILGGLDVLGSRNNFSLTSDRRHNSTQVRCLLLIEQTCLKLAAKKPGGNAVKHMVGVAKPWQSNLFPPKKDLEWPSERASLALLTRVIGPSMTLEISKRWWAVRSILSYQVEYIPHMREKNSSRE